jgi:predicted Zn-dependent protease
VLGIGAVPSAAAQAPVRLPALGESASDDVQPLAEKRIGEQIMREIRRDPAYLDDPQLLDYLQSLWAPLVRTARQHGDIDADTERLFPGKASWCATAASTPSRCQAATWACTWA